MASDNSLSILVLGAGLMGPAAAYNAMRAPEIGRVTLLDLDPVKLGQAGRKLNAMPGAEKLRIHAANLADRDSTLDLFREHDVILAALPWQASMPAVMTAIDAGVPLVDLAIPDDDQMAEFRKVAGERNGSIVLGAGLEPGLTEIEARRLAGMLDSVSEFHIKVGGVPEKPTGPLGYKIVFGGDRLPLRWIDALVVENGERRNASRYSGLESVRFEGTEGELEAWNEGVIPWLLELPEMAGIREATQKTIRWPGYAAKAQALNELGLLSTDPIRVGDVDVIPKDVVDTVLRPHVTMSEDDRDITYFRVDIIGEKDGVKKLLRTDMVDHFDEATGFTSMARTTAFTGAIIARMIARGEITPTGLETPDRLIVGKHYDRMIAELKDEGVVFTTKEIEV